MPKNLIIVNSTYSTNDEINSYSVDTVLIAQKQDKGRGRHGKSWLSPIGGLYFSYKIDLPLICSRGFIPIIVGIACHKVLSELSEQKLRLKWPNDILDSNEKKLAGILIESKKDFTGKEICIIGIGINLIGSLVEDFGFLITNWPPSLITELIAKKIDQMFETSNVNFSSECIDYWQAHSVFQEGDCVEVYTKQKTDIVRGLIGQLDKDGFLYMKTEKNDKPIPLNIEQAHNLRKISSSAKWNE